MLIQVLAVLTLFGTALLAYYLRRVPEGAVCPRCGDALRRTPAGKGPRWRLLARWTDDAHCARCDWEGPVRRGPEAEPVCTPRVAPHQGGRP